MTREELEAEYIMLKETAAKDYEALCGKPPRNDHPHDDLVYAYLNDPVVNTMYRNGERLETIIKTLTIQKAELIKKLQYIPQHNTYIIQ